VRVLVTGSSGWLAQALVPRLRAGGHSVFGIDPAASPRTQCQGSIADRALVRRVIRDQGIEAILHCGALHKPQVATHPRDAFVATNIQGTLNLLEEACAPSSTVSRFVLTSTTSLMISRAVRDGAGDAAAWMTEDYGPLLPRNIYGVSKLAAEHLCRMMHELHGLPVVVLRTARFFPEEDDMAHAIEQNDENTKTNELLFRRAAVEDMAEAHVVAMERAPDIGFDTFIIAAPTPFAPADARALMVDAPAVVRRYHPEYAAIYAERGWTMFRSIDRVYDAGKAARVLGFRCRHDFGAALRALAKQG
jgi:UDP-glucose 4-epimerase